MGSMRDLWSVDSLPASFESNETDDRSFEMLPPPGGLVVRLGQLLPDEQWKDADIAGMFDSIGGGDTHIGNDNDVGLHVTETVDCVTIVSGEVVAVLESEEVVLKAGETLIQRGTKHSWSNRGNEPAVMLITMMSAAGSPASTV
jgi:mannose-6-phosphate isomerase-like protein (cupin superfamily)